MNPKDLPTASQREFHGPACFSTFVVGELLGLSDNGRTAHVTHAGLGDGPALFADTTVDLQARHIGRPVVIVLSDGPEKRAIVMGVLQSVGWPLEQAPGGVDVEADGQRMIVSAERELVLRCGQSSLTLRHDGCIEVRGRSILTHADGANRIRGGSVQLN